MHKLIAIYNQPPDPAHFRRHLEEVHLPLVAKFPGLRGMRHGFDVSSATSSAFYAVVECEFDSEATMKAALASPAAQAAAADVPNYAAAGVTILTFAVAPTLPCEAKLDDTRS
jgi:uncharacterized protein (TIGR02118 family)